MIDKELSDHINRNFPKLLKKLLTAERKDKRSVRQLRKRFININDYLWKTSQITPFESNEGISIYLNEISFHLLDLAFPNGGFVDRWVTSTGAFATAFELTNDSTVYVVCINSDVYDFIGNEKLLYIKYFTIAHEIGHCINDDSNHPLNIDHSIASTEKRMEVKECIQRELNADKTGYEKVILGYEWFGDFEFNPKLTLTTPYRRYQHVCNWLYCKFGTNGLKVLKDYFRTDNILDIGSHFVDLKKYECNSTEDKKRRKLFEKYFC